MNRRVVLLAAAAIAVLPAGCQEAEVVAPQPVQAATAGLDHTAFDAILRAHVKEGKVDYGTLKAEHGEDLAGHLQSLAKADPRAFAEADDELAFWLNAYNAFVIAGVLERYPDIESVMGVKDFFKDERWEAAGKLYSLGQIENAIIRPRFKDPRIHFVLVCAAQSCPPLQPYAMLGAQLQRDLENITREVVNDDRYVQIDPKTKKLRLTRIMSWYKQDFVEKDGSLEAFLMRYLEEPRKSQLEQGGYTIEFMEYDWALNDAGGSSTR